MKLKLYNLSHDFAAPAEDGKPIFMPFGTWPYDDKVDQTFDRTHAERIAADLAADIASGNPGIPVYQGHPDVPELAQKYPDKGALGWIKRIDVSDSGVSLVVEWDRFPGKGFGWFSPYWFGESAPGSAGKALVTVDTIASVGLVNNPNISEFRLPNESAEDNTKGNTMNIEELKKLLGLPPEATEDQIKAALADLMKAREEKAAAEQKAEAAAQDVATANADCETAKKKCETAKNECCEAKKELENCRKELETAKSALANEKAEHEKLKALKTQPVTAALANEHAKINGDRMALVNEIAQKENISFDAAWSRAKKQKPDLFV